MRGICIQELYIIMVSLLYLDFGVYPAESLAELCVTFTAITIMSASMCFVHRKEYLLEVWALETHPIARFSVGHLGNGIRRRDFNLRLLVCNDTDFQAGCVLDKHFLTMQAVKGVRRILACVLEEREHTTGMHLGKIGDVPNYKLIFQCFLTTQQTHRKRGVPSESMMIQQSLPSTLLCLATSSRVKVLSSGIQRVGGGKY